MTMYVCMSVCRQSHVYEGYYGNYQTNQRENLEYLGQCWDREITPDSHHTMFSLDISATI